MENTKTMGGNIFMSKESSSLGKIAIANVFGFWSALLTTLFTISFIIATFIFSPKEWHGMDTFVAEFNPNQMIVWVPCFLFALSYLVTLTSINTIIFNERKIFSQLGLAFAIIYVVISCLNSYLQVTVMRLNVLTGDTNGLAILALPNPHSITYALEAIGYGFLGLSTLFASGVFIQGRLERWIKWLFIVNGIIGIIGIIITVLDKPILMLPGLGLWCIEYPILNILLCIFFKRQQKVS
jgi:hypothetical protein